MFPIRWNEAFRKKDGTLGTMEEAGGGGGGSFTPDYENEVLNIGTVGNWAYYIPMSKIYLGPTTSGYEIESKSISQYDASLDIFSILVNNDGEIVSKTLIQNVQYQSTGYSDDNIEVVYTGSSWSLTLKRAYNDLEGDPITSPVTWGYSERKDLKMVEQLT